MQTPTSRRLVSPKLLTIIVTLILLSTGLFVVGVLIERGPGTAVATSSNQKTPASVSSADPDGGHEETPPGKPETASTAGLQAGGNDERIFGLDLENPWFVGAFVLVWLLLGAALFRLGYLVWLALLVVALVTTVLDVGEVTRKMTEANTTVALIAGGVAVAHVLLAALAGLTLVRWIRGRAEPAGSGRAL